MEKQQITKVPNAVERWLDFMFDALFNKTKKEAGSENVARIHNQPEPASKRNPLNKKN